MLCLPVKHENYCDYSNELQSRASPTMLVITMKIADNNNVVLGKQCHDYNIARLIYPSGTVGSLEGK